MKSTISKKELYNDIYNNYTVANLKTLYPFYLSPFNTERDLVKLNSLNKEYLSKLFTDILVNYDKASKLIEVLSKNIKFKEMAQLLIWEDVSLYSNEIDKILKITTLEKKGYEYIITNTAYQFFIINKEYSYYSEYKFKFSLPKYIRYALQQHFNLPEIYKLKAFDKKPKEKELYIFDKTDKYISELIAVSNYIKHKDLKFSSNGEKILKGTLKDVKDFASITEFYSSQDAKKIKDLEFLKTDLLINLLRRLEIDYFYDEEDLLKQIFKKYSSGKHFYTYNFLNHIKKLRIFINDSYYHYDESEYFMYNLTFIKSFIILLKSLEPSKWYDFTNLVKVSSYNSYNFDTIPHKYARNMQVRMIVGRYEETKDINTKDLYHNVVTIPALKATMFLFSALGFLDISFKLPENENYRTNNGYLTVFDGLKSIKINPLGAYILGLSKNYKFEESKIERAEIRLDEKELIIYLSAEDKIKDLLLKSFADKINSKTYKVTYSSFLRDCLFEKQLKSKISLFKKDVSKNPPEIWQRFFTEITNNVLSLENKSDFNLFKLPDNKKLTEYFVKDEILSKYILKAEDFHILIQDKNINKVRNRLEELGYLKTII